MSATVHVRWFYVGHKRNEILRNVGWNVTFIWGTGYIEWRFEVLAETLM
jgi:hypothetical protein